MKKILFVCPYPPDQAPSQRFRFEQYLSQLNEDGFGTVICSFFSQKGYSLYQSGNLLSKIYSVTGGYIRRCMLLFQLSRYEMIFLHREATPAGPPIAEYVMAKIIGKKMIYDFDDPIWFTDNEEESFLAALLRCRWKVRFICRWSYKVSCGNAYLADYASRFNARVFVNPTTIDTNLHLPRTTHNDSAGKVVIGWTGSQSTVKYLRSIIPVLQILEVKYPENEYLIIADKDPALPLKNVVFRPWRKVSEITDLAEMDIGIMPMPDDAWTQGKCGFKALQYMAMEIPAVVSPVGVSKEIVQNGVEGYWCDSFNEWFTRLAELMVNPEARIQMGKRGRQKVIAHYSVESNAENFLSLFQ